MSFTVFGIKFGAYHTSVKESALVFDLCIRCNDMTRNTVRSCRLNCGRKNINDTGSVFAALSDACFDAVDKHLRKSVILIVFGSNDGITMGISCFVSLEIEIAVLHY
jgi:hypothetical protein